MHAPSKDIEKPTMKQNDDTLMVRDEAQKVAFLAQLIRIYRDEGTQGMIRAMREMGIPEKQIPQTIERVIDYATR